MDSSDTKSLKEKTSDILLCPACHAHELTRLEMLRPVEVYRGYPLADHTAAEHLAAYLQEEVYDIYQCCYCGTESAHPLVAPSRAWYSVLYENLKLYPTNRWEYDFVTRRIIAGCAVADIGCGDGQFVQKALVAGLDAQGFDFSTSAIAAGVETGLPLRVMSIDDIVTMPQDSYTEIVCFHLLEHLSNPADLFRAASRIGRPNARLWVSVPSNRRASRFFREHDVLDSPPHHLTRWTAQGLDQLGRLTDWRLNALIYEPITLKETIWHVTRRLRAYRLMEPLMTRNIWLERLGRTMLFPWALVKSLVFRNKITGFSMLAQFEKCN